ncbi:hypothetical protein ACHWQZ_G003312 [Mnemiopsis leidyi]
MLHKVNRLSSTPKLVLSSIHSAVINNANVNVESESSFQSINPATGLSVGSVSNCGEKETLSAIASAKDCFKMFKGSLHSSRAKLLIDWADLITKNNRKVAELVTLEMGKPFSESLGEVNYATSFLYHFAAHIRSGLVGEMLTPGMAHWRPVNVKQPVGPVVTITPWNFPVAMVTRKAGAAIAAGCSVINAPSEDTPLVSLCLAKLAVEAGFPPGLFNVLPSTIENKQRIGKILCEDPRISALSFTGSTPVGKLLSKQCADTVKRVHLELGGNAPLIVFETADIDRAVAGTMMAKFKNAGQACNAANRILVQKSIYTEFVGKLAEKFVKLKMGNGMEKGVSIGPLVNSKAYKKVSSIVNGSLAVDVTNVDVISGNKDTSIGDDPFYTPVILSCQENNHLPIFHEEIFGPVAAIYSFDTEAEAVEMANNTRYGLQAYIFTKDMAQSWRVSENLECGMVAVNEGAISNANNPFGGWKESGIGREAGHLGIDEFTEDKLICFGL